VTRRSALFLFALYLIVAFALTHVPGSSVPKLSWTDRIPAADKIAHTGLYFLLAALLANCLRFWLRSNRVIVLITLGILAAYAAFDEWSQQFSPHRSPDVLDFVADMIGATCGVSLFAIWRWIRRQKRRSQAIVGSQKVGQEAIQMDASSPVAPPVAHNDLELEPADFVATNAPPLPARSTSPANLEPGHSGSAKARVTL